MLGAQMHHNRRQRLAIVGIRISTCQGAAAWRWFGSTLSVLVRLALFVEELSVVAS